MTTSIQHSSQNRPASQWSPPCLLLTVRHFAERGAAILGLTFFPFSSFQMASWLHSSLASVVDGKDDNVHHQRDPRNPPPPNDHVDARAVHRRAHRLRTRSIETFWQ